MSGTTRLSETADLLNTINATRLARKGNSFPYYTSTKGISLFKSSVKKWFFFLYWSKLSEDESRILPCTEGQAFEFLYSLYGSKFTDTTDEDLDAILKEHFPGKIFCQ